MPGSDEDIPYRSHVPEGIVSDDKPTKDEAQYDTLKAVHLSLKEAVDNLDKWHAFDLAETDELTLKQQILAHRIAFHVLTPLLSSVENALAVVDDKYRNR